MRTAGRCTQRSGRKETRAPANKHTTRHFARKKKGTCKNDSSGARRSTPTAHNERTTTAHNERTPTAHTAHTQRTLPQTTHTPAKATRRFEQKVSQLKRDAKQRTCIRAYMKEARHNRTNCQHGRGANKQVKKRADGNTTSHAKAREEPRKEHKKSRKNTQAQTAHSKPNKVTWDHKAKKGTRPRKQARAARNYSTQARPETETRLQHYMRVEKGKKTRTVRQAAHVQRSREASESGEHCARALTHHCPREKHDARKKHNTTDNAADKQSAERRTRTDRRAEDFKGATHTHKTRTRTARQKRNCERQKHGRTQETHRQGTRRGREKDRPQEGKNKKQRTQRGKKRK
ncbi:hypothetical protein, conserved in T. vivax [Trypanosoma vivax Y486]|uniref:Uncharacterized protein n=1 Tax=Trypanosoma vivax (strain Y486) TaxID=1055687 RepID=F9WV54_TRYVY|nr:hypothetical protein, conserved in T. vivax [Trypanosoma vivax Y486]|eukprot:CCD21459.1 hypothetical protein, conserved in T. vivax [Trypanosoma vivax Y486]